MTRREKFVVGTGIGLVFALAAVLWLLYAQRQVAAAEAFMPGYWVTYSTQGLEPTGAPHSAEYHRHHRWIELRDRFPWLLDKGTR